MRKSVALLATTAALVAVPVATATALSMPQVPRVPLVHISANPPVDPALLMVELDTSDGLRVALHLAGTRIVNFNLSDHTDQIVLTAGPYLRVLDCHHGRFVDCGILFIGSIAPVRLQAPAAAGAVTTTTVTKVTGAVTAVQTTVTEIVTSVRPPVAVPTVTVAVPTVAVPTIQVPTVQVPTIQVPAVLPALPADPGSIGGLVSGVLGSVDATLGAVLGTPPTLPVTAPAPQSLLGALLG